MCLVDIGSVRCAWRRIWFTLQPFHDFIMKMNDSLVFSCLSILFFFHWLLKLLFHFKMRGFSLKQVHINISWHVHTSVFVYVYRHTQFVSFSIVPNIVIFNSCLWLAPKRPQMYVGTDFLKLTRGQIRHNEIATWECNDRQSICRPGIGIWWPTIGHYLQYLVQFHR